ncbi:MAG: penicillin acylase family protein [Promethearchaeota archaeon]
MKLKTSISEKFKKFLDKKKHRRLSTTLVLTILIITIFSIPLGIIPALGRFLFPGYGIWNSPGEIPVEERLDIPELEDDVTVYRDEWGIPHIYASHENDLFFAQGYCHAQDRYFQMDMWRRQVRGKMSEVVGEMYLSQDKFNLAMGMEYWANKTLQKLKTNPFFDNMVSYVDGVNYYLNTHKNEKQMEYHLMNFEPTNWTMLDSLCLVQEMARQMSWGYNDFYRLLNYEALGSAKYNELFGLPAPYQIPICPNYGEFPEAPKAAGIESESDETQLSNTIRPLSEPDTSVITEITSFLDHVQTIESERTRMEFQDVIGSNNWVITGKKSITGKPILNNDMHLAWMLPGVWYEQHLISEDTGLNSYGFAIPGMPLCAVGHNEHVAWGFTNTGFDVLDWYYYKTFGSEKYIYNGKVTDYTTRTHVINVKGQAPVKLTVRETVHGPVLSDLRDFGTADTLGDVVIAPQWTANDIYYNLLAGYKFNHAKNRNEFDQASRYWDTLAQNIVYGDVHGNIAIRPTGKVPIRAGNGFFPYDGSIGQGEWTGYVSFDDLPNTVNPDQDYLTSANQIVAGPDYKYPNIQTGYASGYRTRRINEVLRANYFMDIDKMIMLQRDVKSSAAKAFTPYLINAIESRYGSNPQSTVGEVLTELKDWNYVMDRELAAPTIYRKFRDYFSENTFDDELDYYGAVYDPSLPTLEYLMKEDENSEWFDNINTKFNVENRDDIIIEALLDAIEWLEEYYGSSDPSAWRWGDVHKLYFGHLFGLANKGPYEHDGEGYTVTPSRVSLGRTIRYARGGASERMIVDLSDLNNSISVIPSGERANSNSKHYSDQLEDLFLKGRYHYQYFTNTVDDFPENVIESRIYFTATGGE